LQFENILLTTAFEKKQLLQILRDLTFEDFCKQSEGWLNSARFVWFVHGNMTKQQAVGLVERARGTFSLKKIAKEDLVDVRCIAIPAGNKYLL
jgi:secreted Zn-dependent insulinase-like peptidase